MIDYYASQPLGLTADYRILDARQRADDVIVSYQWVDFGFTDRPTLPGHLATVLRKVESAWLIDQYHVSKLDKKQPHSIEGVGRPFMNER